MESRQHDQFKKMLLGTIPGQDDVNIRGSKLPTKRQVIICLLANMIDQPWDEALSVTIDNVLLHYDKAGVPTVSGRKNVGAIIKKLHDEYMGLMKYNESRRNLENPGIKKFVSTLDDNMKFYKKSVLEDMAASKRYKSNVEIKAIDADIAFMKSMLTDRKASYAGIDKITERSTERRQKRTHDEAFLKRNYDSTINQIAELESSSSCEEETVPSTSFSEPKRKHRRISKSGEKIFVPHDILKDPNVVAWSVRNKISHTQVSSFVSMLISTCGGDTSKINLSASTALRYRSAVIPDITKQIKAQWNPSPRMLVHWDGKLMSTLDSKDTDDRLPILVSGINGIKLLGVPPLPSSTKKIGLKQGEVISEATKNLLLDWDCDQNIIGMVFDTTASNTGHISGACICLQKELDRPLLWFACRRHVGEVMLANCWDSLNIEASSGPNISIFVRFKKNFKDLHYDDKMAYYYPELPELIHEEQEHLINFLRESLNKNFTRGDYRELVELSLLIITKGSEPQQFKMRHPGAMHKARWMGKLLYTLKIVLLSKNIADLFPNAQIGTNTQFKKLERFCVFAVSVYVEWWIVCPLAASAPVNDLILHEKLKSYRLHDQILAEKCQAALDRHSWYLHEELIPLALFSPATSVDVKESLRQRLLQIQKDGLLTDRIGTAYGKPNLKPIPDSQASLTQMLGPGSLSFFTIIDCSHEFLNVAANQWEDNNEYLEMKKIVENIQVVNEAAERGVKLCNDFLGVTKSENRFQDVLQVVESSRKRIPNQRKVSSERPEKCWFLVHNE